MGRRKKRQKKMAVIEAENPDLPSEVIYSILSKLPVKSLLRFKCVCRSWKTLISEPNFIKTHLSGAINSERRRLLIQDSNSRSFRSIDSEFSRKPVQQLRFPIKKYSKAQLYSSCNGLVVLGGNWDKCFVLWNPSIRAFTRFSCPYFDHDFDNYFALCYASSTGDYKLVFIKEEEHQFHFAVFTFKNNLWTETRDFQYVLYYPNAAVNVRGAPHWVAVLMDDDVMNGRDNGTDVILYFDPMEEKFKEMPTPSSMQGKVYFKLTVVRGWLSLYQVLTGDSNLIEVWAMKEYGIRDSWTKLLTIPCQVGSGILSYPNLLRFTEEGNVVMSSNDDNTLLLYNPKRDMFVDLTTTTDMRTFVSVIFYTESLVLPPSDKLAWKEKA